jgi:3'-phosphoadenosine 5'-phosphosulfate sulfotransferase (PAPS reductase)/FAD synthetase
MTKQEFDILYHLPLDIKIEKTKQRIREFYQRLGGCFLSFSGGKDSQVLGEIIRSMEKPYCNIPFVFFDTGNERPEVKKIIKRYGAEVVESLLTPKQVMDKVGYPLFNKEIANAIVRRRNGQMRSLNPKTDIQKRNAKRVDELELFVNSPLKISDKCCDWLKKYPCKRYTKRTGLHPIIATLAVDSTLRFAKYLEQGCNVFSGKIKSTPMGFWSKKDVLQYIADHDLKIAKCYKADIYADLTGYKHCELHGVTQTGCMFCGFGKGMAFAKKILQSNCPDYVKLHQKEFDELK